MSAAAVFSLLAARKNKSKKHDKYNLTPELFTENHAMSSVAVIFLVLELVFVFSSMYQTVKCSLVNPLVDHEASLHNSAFAANGTRPDIVMAVAMAQTGAGITHELTIEELERVDPGFGMFPIDKDVVNAHCANERLVESMPHLGFSFGFVVVVFLFFTMLHIMSAQLRRMVEAFPLIDVNNMDSDDEEWETETDSDTESTADDGDDDDDLVPLAQTNAPGAVLNDDTQTQQRNKPSKSKQRRRKDPVKVAHTKLMSFSALYMFVKVVQIGVFAFGGYMTVHYLQSSKEEHDHFYTFRCGDGYEWQHGTFNMDQGRNFSCIPSLGVTLMMLETVLYGLRIVIFLLFIESAWALRKYVSRKPWKRARDKLLKLNATGGNGTIAGILSQQAKERMSAGKKTAQSKAAEDAAAEKEQKDAAAAVASGTATTEQRLRAAQAKTDIAAAGIDAAQQGHVALISRACVENTTEMRPAIVDALKAGAMASIDFVARDNHDAVATGGDAAQRAQGGHAMANLGPTLFLIASGAPMETIPEEMRSVYASALRLFGSVALAHMTVSAATVRATPKPVTTTVTTAKDESGNANSQTSKMKKKAAALKAKVKSQLSLSHKLNDDDDDDVDVAHVDLDLEK